MCRCYQDGGRAWQLAMQAEGKAPPESSHPTGFPKMQQYLKNIKRVTSGDPSPPVGHKTGRKKGEQTLAVETVCLCIAFGRENDESQCI